jgi:endonuclease/exonuclease/phosphatase (EEP) superfamily protein YafD
MSRSPEVIEAIAHCAPDIVLLQEVDDGVPRSRRDRQVDRLADGLSLPHRAYQRNVILREGNYGNAILSRFPLYDIRHLELTVPLKKRRRGLAAHCRLRFEGHQKTLLVFNLHLGLAGFERAIQLRRFLISDILKHAHASTPVIAAGDFNDVWGGLGKRLLEPAGFIPACRQITRRVPNRASRCVRFSGTRKWPAGGDFGMFWAATSFCSAMSVSRSYNEQARPGLRLGVLSNGLGTARPA